MCLAVDCPGAELSAHVLFGPVATRVFFLMPFDGPLRINILLSSGSHCCLVNPNFSLGSLAVTFQWQAIFYLSSFYTAHPLAHSGFRYATLHPLPRSSLASVHHLLSSLSLGTARGYF